MCGGGVYLGVVPDTEEPFDPKKGLRLAEITEKSPADKAGIKPGDRLLTVNDAPLENVQSLSRALRGAKVGDKLVSTKFTNSITRGFTAIGEPNVAVCLMPGTELAFDRDVECEAALAIFPTKKIGQRVARFRQINVEQPTMHHDALEFPDGSARQDRRADEAGGYDVPVRGWNLKP